MEFEGLSACECPVCFLILDDSEQLPMSMPCGHTLCKGCVHQLTGKSSTSTSFQCPICRQWVDLQSISLNVTLRDLLSELKKIEKKNSAVQGDTLHVSYSELELLEALDRGAFGEVWRAVWRSDEVAVKVLAAGRLTPEAMQAFQREVFVMNCLRHPNVVLLLGACQTPPHLAIIMEYVAGGSLHQLVHINKHIPTPEHTALLATDICRGLQYLHSINVMHRDLKSKNVLLSGPLPCQAKLCDFGLARMRQESATMTGNVGTVHWTAPEILSNQRYQFPADIYGFGMVLFEMVVGRVPLGHMNPMAVMLAVAMRKEQPVIPDNAHPLYQELIKRCIDWEAGLRPSLPYILSALGELLPRRQNSSGSTQSGRLEHQDSLGVVFLSATDSTDLADQDSHLQELARRQQGAEDEAIQPPHQATPPLPSKNAAPYYISKKAPPSQTVAPPLPPRPIPKIGRSENYNDLTESYEDLFMYGFTSPQTSPPMPPAEVTSHNMAMAMQSHIPLGRVETHQYPATRKMDMFKKKSKRATVARDASELESEWVAKEEAVPAAQSNFSKRNVVQVGEGREEELGGGDLELALSMQEDAYQAQLESDYRLAEQLQLKENQFSAPLSTQSPLPPQNLLNSIRSQKGTRTKSSFSADEPTLSESDSVQNATTHRAIPTISKAPPTEHEATPTSSMSRKMNWLRSMVTRKGTTSSSSSSPSPHRKREEEQESSWKSKLSSKSSSIVNSIKTKTVQSLSSGKSPPPPPPPPPPRPHPHHSPLTTKTTQQLLLREVRTKAPTVARQLKPVQTVEKRAFRVGRVVDGYDSERSQYTTQSLVLSFNRKLLRHVEPPHTLLVFPVGKVVQTSYRVKRMSSKIEAAQNSLATPLSLTAPPPPPPPPPPLTGRRKQLHPAIRYAIEQYSHKYLQHVVPAVRQSLPDKEAIEQEKSLMQEEGEVKEKKEEEEEEELKEKEEDEEKEVKEKEGEEEKKEDQVDEEEEEEQEDEDAEEEEEEKGEVEEEEKTEEEKVEEEVEREEEEEEKE